MVLVALLGGMLAGSTLLADTVDGLVTDRAIVWFSLPLSAGYFLLGWAIYRQHKWDLWLAFLLLVGVLSVGIADLERPGRMALGSTLTLVMAGAATMAAMIALSIPQLDRVIDRAEAADQDPGSG